MPRTFVLFPTLPPELRHKIYTLATTPRLLPIYPVPSRIRAPVPPLLHTCREARLFLISSGYRLAFSLPGSDKDKNEQGGGEQWFHPGIDTIFPVKAEPSYELITDPPSFRVIQHPWFDRRFSAEDRKSVKRIAVLGSCASTLNGVNPWREVLVYLRLFAEVEWLDVVESMEFVAGWRISARSFLESFVEVGLSVVEVGVEEVRGWVDGDVCGVVCRRFGVRMGEWIRGGREEREFLGSCYGSVEALLRKEKERVKGEWKVPCVRSVQIVTGWGKGRIERYREKYWEVRAERERMDIRGRYRDRPASPFSEMFEDELEVVREIQPMLEEDELVL